MANSSTNQLFACKWPGCGGFYDNEEAFRTHLLSHIQSVPCYQCSATFPTREAAYQHFSTAHLQNSGGIQGPEGRQNSAPLQNPGNQNLEQIHHSRSLPNPGAMIQNQGIQHSENGQNPRMSQNQNSGIQNPPEEVQNQNLDEDQDLDILEIQNPKVEESEVQVLEQLQNHGNLQIPRISQNQEHGRYPVTIRQNEIKYEAYQRNEQRKYSAGFAEIEKQEPKEEMMDTVEDDVILEDPENDHPPLPNLATSSSNTVPLKELSYRYFNRIRNTEEWKFVKPEENSIPRTPSNFCLACMDFKKCDDNMEHSAVEHELNRKWRQMVADDDFRYEKGALLRSLERVCVYYAELDCANTIAQTPPSPPPLINLAPTISRAPVAPQHSAGSSGALPTTCSTTATNKPPIFAVPTAPAVRFSAAPQQAPPTFAAPLAPPTIQAPPTFAAPRPPTPRRRTAAISRRRPMIVVPPSTRVTRQHRYRTPSVRGVGVTEKSEIVKELMSRVHQISGYNFPKRDNSTEFCVICLEFKHCTEHHTEDEKAIQEHFHRKNRNQKFDTTSLTPVLNIMRDQYLKEEATGGH